MKFIIVDKISVAAENHRRSVIFWFAYHFFTVGLCITNIVFFVCNCNDLTISLSNETNILLTIIGFLFAFAGINIYSIFNTNIEAEKARLVEMKNQYAETMESSLRSINFASDMSKLQLYAQMTYSLKTSNSQLLEWLDQISNTISRIKDSLEKARLSESNADFCAMSNDVTALARGLGYMSSTFVEYIESNEDLFFDRLDIGNRNYVKNKIAAVYQEIDSLLPDNIVHEVQEGSCVTNTIYNHLISNKYVKKLVNWFKNRKNRNLDNT